MNVFMKIHGVSDFRSLRRGQSIGYVFASGTTEHKKVVKELNIVIKESTERKKEMSESIKSRNLYESWTTHEA